MYLVIRTASDVKDDKVTRVDMTIVGVEVSTDKPTYVTGNNEYVYVDLDTVDDMDTFINNIINNLGTARVSTSSPVGITEIKDKSVILNGSNTDRLLDPTTWNSSVPMAWSRALATVNMNYL